MVKRKLIRLLKIINTGKSINTTDFYFELLKGFMSFSQLNEALNSSGETLVFDLNNLLNDCGYSKPRS